MNEKHTKTNIGVLVLMHGDKAASDLAQTANQLLKVDHAVGLNMPLSQSVGETLEKATQIVKEINQGKGVVLLSDMGSLKDRKSTRLNSSHVSISYAVFCLK